MSHVVCLLADARRALGNDPGHCSRASAQELAARARLQDPLRAQIASARRVCRRTSVTTLLPTLVSPFGSAGGLALLAQAVAAVMRFAFSGCSTLPSKVLRAGWKVRAMGLFPASARLLLICRRRIQCRSHPTSTSAALRSPIHCYMLRCASRILSVRTSYPNACVRL